MHALVLHKINLHSTQMHQQIVSYRQDILYNVKSSIYHSIIHQDRKSTNAFTRNTRCGLHRKISNNTKHHFIYYRLQHLKVYFRLVRSSNRFPNFVFQTSMIKLNSRPLNVSRMDRQHKVDFTFITIYQM